VSNRPEFVIAARPKGSEEFAKVNFGRLTILALDLVYKLNLLPVSTGQLNFAAAYLRVGLPTRITRSGFLAALVAGWKFGREDPYYKNG
jgi:hypothetical protein